MSQAPKTLLLDTVNIPADLRKLDKSDLRQLADELRAEVTSLREKVLQGSNRVQQAEAQRRDMKEEVQAMRDQFTGETAEQPSSAAAPHQELAFQDLPPGVQTTLRSQYNGVRFGELVKNQDDGRVTYSMHGEQADGRNVEAILDPQGNVMEQYLDVYLEELPDPVKQRLRSQVNLDGESSFSQIWDAGNTFYTGSIEYDGSEVSVTIGPDGRLREWAETRHTGSEEGPGQ